MAAASDERRQEIRLERRRQRHQLHRHIQAVFADMAEDEEDQWYELMLESWQSGYCEMSPADMARLFQLEMRSDRIIDLRDSSRELTATR